MKHPAGSLSAAEFLNHPLPQSFDASQTTYAQHEKLVTMIGVLLVMLLASLDQTIVSTALPRIAADLQGFDRYTWISTSYLLTSTVMVPIYGELSDLLGRKPIFLFGLVIFLLGSALSGTAQSMNALIAFRAFQGLGAGALLPIAFAIVGDLFTPRERGRWQGLTGAIFGFSAIIGPLIGGWFTQNLSWHWIFYVNVPIGIVALLVLIFLMPPLRPTNNRHPRIDYIGAVLLIVGVVPLLLGFTLAGSQFSWTSPQIIGLFILATGTLIGFVVYERYVETHGGYPILEPSLFRNSIFAISILITIFSSIGLFGAIFFIPLFVQGIVGISSAESGLILAPLLLTAVGGSVLVGQVVSRMGRYKALAIIGLVFSVIGTACLLLLDVHSKSTNVLLAMVILGIGLGFSMALYAVIVQNAIPSKIGQTTAALTFFRSIGQTIGLAIMGSLMNAAYFPAFTQTLPSAVKLTFPSSFLALFKNPQVLLSASSQEQLRLSVAPLGPQGQSLLNETLAAAKAGLTQGIHLVFILCFIVMCISLLFVFFLKEIPLQGKNNSAAVVQPASSKDVAPKKPLAALKGVLTFRT